MLLDEMVELTTIMDFTMMSCNTLLLLAAALSGYLPNINGDSDRSISEWENSPEDYSGGEIITDSSIVNNSLNLANMGLTHLREGFANSQYLEWLTLEKNQLTDFPSGTFKYVPNLKYLNLAANQFDNNLSLRQFSGLKKLETLILDGNHDGLPYTLDPDGKYHDPRTGYWSNDGSSWYNSNGYIVENRGITEKEYIRVNLDTNLPALTHLYLRNNSIEGISYWSGLPNLTHLHVSDNALVRADDSLEGLRSIPSLRHLFLENNDISILNISQLDNIMSLSIDGNKFESLCNQYCEPLALCLKGGNQLQFLSVSNNKIAKIETDAFNYTDNLTHLNLSSNSISIIRERTFDKLSHLQFLSLEKNDLFSISAASLTGLSSLTYLSLSYNQISKIPQESFNGLVTIEKIFLNNNKISTIELDAFSELSNLEELSLANNLLGFPGSIPSRWLPQNGVLQQLDISHNMIDSAKQLSLYNSSYLSTLNLQCNPLTSMKMQLFTDLPENLTLIIGCKCEQSPPIPPGLSYDEYRIMYGSLRG